jgi:ribosomal protein L22
MEKGDTTKDVALPRPMGQKKAKQIVHEGNGKSKESAINLEGLDKFEKIQNEVHVNRLKALEIAGKINIDKMETTKIALERAKEEKEAKLIETYSSLLKQDTSVMPDDVRIEHVTALRCLRKKLFPELP